VPAVEIRPEPLDSPVAQQLIAELNAELSRDYKPEERFHSLATEEVAEGRIRGGLAGRRARQTDVEDARRWG
jgi:hypothetical protein